MNTGSVFLIFLGIGFGLMSCGQSLQTAAELASQTTAANNTGSTSPNSDNTDSTNSNGPVSSNPPAENTPPVDTPSTVDPVENTLGINDVLQVSSEMGWVVDKYYKNNQLTKSRIMTENFMVDNCPTDFNNDKKGNYFSDRISYGVFKRFEKMPLQIGSVRTLFGLSSSTANDQLNSLISHPFCDVNASTFQSVYQGKHIPTAATIAKAQKFTQTLNKYRTMGLNGDLNSQKKLLRTWSKFMMCLGYMESLTSADSAESDQIAKQFNFRRPAGVNLHNDGNQTNADSVLGIGIFQNSNVVKDGETYSCVKDWNSQFPSCQIPITTSKSQMIPILASSYQTFNAYCGAAHINRMFGVQINTLKSKNTHPQNVKSDGSLKNPSDRCVTPFTNNISYNHFGPLQNVYDFTLDEVLSCTLDGNDL